MKVRRIFGKQVTVYGLSKADRVAWKAGKAQTTAVKARATKRLNKQGLLPLIIEDTPTKRELAARIAQGYTIKSVSAGGGPRTVYTLVKSPLAIAAQTRAVVVPPHPDRQS